ncbi:hypothetical protein GCM10022242_12180 [Nocardioides panacisoli]|uniref:Uncharacterized protein n=1 Tax=Nocardioides panacisoli TaxID=627624 RepID=A0ABP7I3X5_9ACTN
MRLIPTGPRLQGGPGDSRAYRLGLDVNKRSVARAGLDATVGLIGAAAAELVVAFRRSRGETRATTRPKRTRPKKTRQLMGCCRCRWHWRAVIVWMLAGLS